MEYKFGKQSNIFDCQMTYNELIGVFFKWNLSEKIEKKKSLKLHEDRRKFSFKNCSWKEVLGEKVPGRKKTQNHLDTKNILIAI